MRQPRDSFKWFAQACAVDAKRVDHLSAGAPTSLRQRLCAVTISVCCVVSNKEPGGDNTANVVINRKSLFSIVKPLLPLIWQNFILGAASRFQARSLRQREQDGGIIFLTLIEEPEAD